MKWKSLPLPKPAPDCFPGQPVYHRKQKIAASSLCVFLALVLCRLPKVVTLCCVKCGENADVGNIQKMSQMPVVLIPVHFDRDLLSHLPSCQHSVVLRPFLTADFMTGISAQPGKHISLEASFVSTFMYLSCCENAAGDIVFELSASLSCIHDLSTLGITIPGSRIAGSRTVFQFRNPGIVRDQIPGFRDWNFR